MARYTIGIAQRGVNVHTACFEDVAKSLAACLRELGHELTDFGPNQGRIIMFGGNNLAGDTPPEAQDAIVFNTEQVAAVDRPDHLIANYEKYKSHVVWDYSQTNIETLRGLGFQHLVHCPLAYHPTMETIIARGMAVEKDIDILFYGQMCPRRKDVLIKLHQEGLKVCTLFGIYGERRDEYIARAKIVLNVHFYANPVFEIFRVSHLVANKACVVSEDGGCDEELEKQARQLTASMPYNLIVDECLELISSGDWRKQGDFGYREFKKTNLITSVEKALEQS